MAKRVMIGMSGGVDSSVAALLLKQQGYEVVGATFRLFNEGDLKLNGESRCCSLDDVNDARMVCDTIGIPHYVLNYKELFRKRVVDTFVQNYLKGITPNPCIDCNRYIKFEAFLQKARSMGIDYIATGHYARICRNDETGLYSLYRAQIRDKDQSYVLYHLNQHSLPYTLMPLGGYSKAEVRAIAEENGLVVSHKPDSQDICFVPDGDHVGFIKRYTGYKPQEGVFTNKDGKILGHHSGVQNFTIGQRKGLGVSLGRPVFVVDINAAANTVVLGEEQEVFSDILLAGDINMVSGMTIEQPFACMAKIRYSHKEAPATVSPIADGCLRVVFEAPQRAITKGQSVVFYNGDEVLGGGTII
ncbi:tRNA 2-thiouridine(34) synthase MnmA [Acetanaerobacterium elongatum]|uniref:tRNA-specific 2-thiouridylase MnmA n=1 Tax=Acetanaerobacterium elongatum TaxID=258515 RepID=A0A1H0DNQ9_9FIRM|nr:tRNA 2-thiouridine(34) synthase MnmA [Acetanaerobacterium elongatum]SDN71676.1 tRNA-specific 2-thiouridylase [Acetanaerobacterium elongatum]